ncbi:sodium/hydrogen exchanger [Halobacterium sp. DL1]|jgi:CPA2 family monovalent cation:H+ antiporter-2|nr:sodium/hydrogen exchanger [Halobacterium sp. DL1]
MAGPLLLEIGIALLALTVVGALAQRYQQSVIPAYIGAGILVGPYVPTSFGGFSLRLVSDSEFVNTVAELGIILLLFFLGLEFSIGTLLRNRNRLAKVGAIDLVANALVGVAIAAAFGFGLTGIILVAGVVYISSSAVITKGLTEFGWLANPESEVILSTLVVEDIVIAVYLAVVSAAVVGSGPISEAAVTVVQSFAFLAVLAAVAYYGTNYVGRVFAVDSDELFVLRVLGVTVFLGAVALQIGVSEAVAAFFVGTAFNGSGLEDRIEHLLSPVRDVFAALFFFSIGLATDLLVVVDVWLFVAVAVVCTAVSKLLSGFASGRVFGLTDHRSARVGLGLVARGEFSLIIATVAATSAIPAVSQSIPAFTVGYVLVMSLVGSLSIQHGSRLSSLVQS